MDEELAAGSSPKSDGQCLNVWMDISDEWCPSEAGASFLLEKASLVSFEETIFNKELKILLQLFQFMFTWIIYLHRRIARSMNHSL